MKNNQSVELKKVLSFFAALSGGGKQTKDALRSLKKRALINEKDVGEILKKASLGLEKVAKEIKDAPTKNWIYREAITAAYLDRKVTDKERRSLNKIRDMLGLTPEKAREIEKWVRDFIKLADKGNKIIFE